MKENTLKQSLVLILFGAFSFLLASFIPKLMGSFWISIVTMIPIVAVSLGCFLQGFYNLAKLAYQQVKRKITC